MKKHIHLLMIALFSFSALMALPLVGCNTVEGAGEDIESVGEGIEDAAD